MSAAKDRRHAARRRLAGVRALDQGEAILEHGDGGIAEASVDVARLFARRARVALRGRLVDKARGQVERLVGLAVMRANDPATHQLGRRVPTPARVPSAPYAKTPAALAGVPPFDLLAHLFIVAASRSLKSPRS